MKKSIKTFLKHPTKDNSNRSANPAVIRASTILFNTMQELYQHEKKIKSHQKIIHYSYGRYGSSTLDGIGQATISSGNNYLLYQWYTTNGGGSGYLHLSSTSDVINAHCVTYKVA